MICTDAAELGSLVGPLAVREHACHDLVVRRARNACRVDGGWSVTVRV